MNSRPLKMHRQKNGRYEYGKMHVPAEIATLIPDTQLFVCELTEDGILFRPVTGIETEPVAVPAWLEEA